MPREDFDQRQQALRVAEAEVKQAREEVTQVRVSLGLAARAGKGKSLTDVPPDLNQNFSAVRAALADGIADDGPARLPLESVHLTPNQVLDKFSRLDADGNIDRILAGPGSPRCLP